MDIIEIREKWDNGDYTDKTHIPKKLSEDYIFDEELSVKRNRELVKEHNEKIDTLKKEAQKRQNLLHWQLTDDVIAYITENYNLSEPQARAVERFVYQEHHSFMCDYFSHIDTFASFADSLVDCGG